MTTDRPTPLVRIINRSVRWARIGAYECGIEHEVNPEIAEALAARGFVRVDPSAPALVATPATPEE